MPWRVIAYGDKVWHVDAGEKHPAHSCAWRIGVSFRADSGRMQEPALRAPFRPEAWSSSALFLQAERVPDDAPARLMARCLA